MTRKKVWEAVGDGRFRYGSDDVAAELDRLAQDVMEHGDRATALALVHGMVEDGGLLVTVDGASVRIEKGNV